MNYCGMRCDYPFRIQYGPDLVVHAGYKQKVGGHTRYKTDPITGRLVSCGKVPETEKIFVACKRRWSYKKDKDRYEVKESHLLNNTETITCKACARTMGMSEKRTDPARYVIFKRSTKEFYKKGRYCSRPWVEDVGDATLYKVKGIAEKKTMRSYYETIDGRRVTYEERTKLVKAGEAVRNKREKDPDLKLRIVTLVVE